MIVKLTPRQYLNQVFQLNKMIDSYVAELQTLRDMIDGLSAVKYDKEKVKSSPTSSSVENTILKIIALEEKVNAGIDRLIDLKDEIHTAISGVPDQKEQLVLRLRYIEFKGWPEIQAAVDRNERTIFLIHSEALKHFTVPESVFAYKEI